MSLSDFVTIERRFARSARIDSDLAGTPPLVGYVLQESTRKALGSLAIAQVESKQGAFTWTGPYGGGKSSAALLVGNLVGGAKPNKKIAGDIAGVELKGLFGRAFSDRTGPWAVVPVTGSRKDLREAIADAAAKIFSWSAAASQKARISDAAIIAALTKSSEDRGGLLLLIDELGKFLEHAVTHSGDIHLLQELAEASSRSKGRLVVIGILHQAFDQYAGRLSRQARLEWAKVQGRFLDISFLAGADETVSLLGRAVHVEKRPSSARRAAEAVAAAVAQRRPTDTSTLAAALEETWPLNPVAALLLGPLSRQRFAQNERSVFGFLTSSEPSGFSDFLKRTDEHAKTTYTVDLLWDYLTTNFGMALASGADSQRFNLALDAVERAAAKGGPLHVALTKSAAMIETFRNGSGLAVADDVLLASIDVTNRKAALSAIEELVEWAILLRQPRLGGYAMFAGSDFDLNAAVEKSRALPSLDRLFDLPAQVGLGFATAKRHYFRTGSLRSFEIGMCLAAADEDMEAAASRIASRELRSSGVMIALMVEGSVKHSKLEKMAEALALALDAKGVVAAVAPILQSDNLHDCITELEALQRIEAEHHHLQGDRIARREVDARRSACFDYLQSELGAALQFGKWQLGPTPGETVAEPLAVVATHLADAAFPDAPILFSELVQRDRPSSNAAAAVRDLAHAMVRNPNVEDVGLTGFSAEMGLYRTLLRPTGLHRLLPSKRHGFGEPTGSTTGRALRPAWMHLKDLQEATAQQVYDAWARRPIGMKRGVMPIMLLSFLLAHRDRVAIYVDGLFQTDIDDFFVDRLLQNPAAVRLKEASRTPKQAALLSALAHEMKLGAESSSLRVAQKLFQACHTLPLYAQRTSSLPIEVQSVRDEILRADDPESLIFERLAALPLGKTPAKAVVRALEAAGQAFPDLLLALRSSLAASIGVPVDSFAGAAKRADTIKGLTSDLRFDAFATRVAGLETERGDMEGLASLLVHKPASSWTDRDRDEAMLEIARFGRKFRELEALATVRNRSSKTEALAVVVGLNPARTPTMHSFELTDSERQQASSLAKLWTKSLMVGQERKTVQLAALARMVESLASELGGEAS